MIVPTLQDLWPYSFEPYVLCFAPPPPFSDVISLLDSLCLLYVYPSPCPPNIHSQPALECLCLSLLNFPSSRHFLTDSHTCLSAPPYLIPWPLWRRHEDAVHGCQKSLGKLFDMTIWFPATHPHKCLSPFLTSQPYSSQLVFVVAYFTKEVIWNGCIVHSVIGHLIDKEQWSCSCKSCSIYRIYMCQA